MKAKYGNLKPKKKLIHKVRARAASERVPNHPTRLALNRSEPVATPLAGCQVLRLRGLRPSARAGAFSVPIPSPRLLPAARLSIIADDASRGASLGVFASAQFLGAFVGGLIGGRFLAAGRPSDVFFVCVLLAAIWLALQSFGRFRSG